MAVVGDVRAAYRLRSSPAEILTEAERDTNGPRVSYYAGSLGADRPLGKSLAETKTFLNTATATDLGALSTSVGLKIKVETPARLSLDLGEGANSISRRTLVDRASIQLGGLSVGYMPSFFNFTPSLTYTTAYASEQSATLVAYTQSIAGATDITFSLEKADVPGVADPVWGTYGKSEAPDAVVSLRRKFGWGSAQIAAAAHPVHSTGGIACCGHGEHRELGWAAMAGIEGWFELPGGMASEILLNATLSKGALGYLNATNYPADFALSPDGRMFLTDGQAVVVSYGHWWTKTVRNVFSVSAFQTNLETDIMRWVTSGSLVQGALEFVPRRGAALGVEVNYHRDEARGGDRTVLGPPIDSNYVSTALFMRQRF